MKRKIYVSPEVVLNDVYTIKNLALNVVIKNSDVGSDDVATKERHNAETDKKYEDTGWGTLW